MQPSAGRLLIMCLTMAHAGRHWAQSISRAQVLSNQHSGQAGPLRSHPVPGEPDRKRENDRRLLGLNERTSGQDWKKPEKVGPLLTFRSGSNTMVPNKADQKGLFSRQERPIIEELHKLSNASVKRTEEMTSEQLHASSIKLNPILFGKDVKVLSELVSAGKANSSKLGQLPASRNVSGGSLNVLDPLAASEQTKPARLKLAGAASLRLPLQIRAGAVAWRDQSDESTAYDAYLADRDAQWDEERPCASADEAELDEPALVPRKTDPLKSGFRVVADGSRPLVINSRGLITAAKRGPFLSGRPFDAATLSSQLNQSLSPIGPSDEYAPLVLSLPDERPTFLLKPVTLSDTIWRRGSGTPLSVTATSLSPVYSDGTQAGGPSSGMQILGQQTEPVGMAHRKQTLQDRPQQQGAAFQHNPPYKHQSAQVALPVPQPSTPAKTHSVTARPKPDRRSPTSTKPSAYHPHSTTAEQQAQTEPDRVGEQSVQLGAIAFGSSSAQKKPPKVKNRLQQLLISKLLRGQPSLNQTGPSAPTPVPLLSTTVANNVASLLAQKLNSFVRPLSSSMVSGQPALNSLFGIRAGHLPTSPNGGRLKQRLSSLMTTSGHPGISRRTAGVGSLLVSGLIYGLSVLPALMALTGLNPLSDSGASSAKAGDTQRHGAARDKKGLPGVKRGVQPAFLLGDQLASNPSSYAYLVPLLSALVEKPVDENADELEPPGAPLSPEAQQSALKSLYAPPVTVLDASPVGGFSSLHALIDSPPVDTNPMSQRLAHTGRKPIEQPWHPAVEPLVDRLQLQRETGRWDRKRHRLSNMTDERKSLNDFYDSDESGLQIGRPSQISEDHDPHFERQRSVGNSRPVIAPMGLDVDTRGPGPQSDLLQQIAKSTDLLPMQQLLRQSSGEEKHKVLADGSMTTSQQVGDRLREHFLTDHRKQPESVAKTGSHTSQTGSDALDPILPAQLDKHSPYAQYLANERRRRAPMFSVPLSASTGANINTNGGQSRAVSMPATFIDKKPQAYVVGSSGTISAGSSRLHPIFANEKRQASSSSSKTLAVKPTDDFHGSNNLNQLANEHHWRVMNPTKLGNVLSEITSPGDKTWRQEKRPAASTQLSAGKTKPAKSGKKPGKKKKKIKTSTSTTTAEPQTELLDAESELILSHSIALGSKVLNEKFIEPTPNEHEPQDSN